MSQTAMQILTNDIYQTLQDKNNPLLTEERKLMLNVMLLFIESEDLLGLERKQIVEAAKNFSNSAEEAEQYYAITYGQ